jgi:hypothetical protein
MAARPEELLEGIGWIPRHEPDGTFTSIPRPSSIHQTKNRARSRAARERLRRHENPDLRDASSQGRAKEGEPVEPNQYEQQNPSRSITGWFHAFELRRLAASEQSSA